MAASRTVRASGPGTEKEESPPPVWPRLLIRPRVGLRPTTPQNAAGTRMDPPPSVPTCSGPSSAAVAAAAPPLDPPGTWSRFHGLRGGAAEIGRDTSELQSLTNLVCRLLLEKK